MLQAHRERIAAHAKALDDLRRLHEEAHALWDRIVRLSEDSGHSAREALDSLHDQAFALAGRIVELREHAFGEVSHETRLRLTAAVESIHSSRLSLQPELLENR